MYRRDFGVLVLSVFALWWSLQHEGAFEYRKAFYFNLPKQGELSAYHKLPSPVVVRCCYGPELRVPGYKHAMMVIDLYISLFPQLCQQVILSISVGIASHHSFEHRMVNQTR